jgi:hypothetical protein
MPPISSPLPSTTMKRYQITYTDCGETQTWNCSAYDAKHAEEKFWDSCENEGGSQGIRVISVSRVQPLEKRIKSFYAA